MKLNITKILKFNLFCLFLFISQFALAITVNLGSIPLNNSETTINSDIEAHDPWSLQQTVDGNFGGERIFNGWSYIPDSDPHSITWTWQDSPTPTLAENQRVDYYTYSISLHNGWTERHNFREYTLSAGNSDDTNGLNLVTNYESVTNRQSNTISVDSNGTVTTTQPPGDSGIFDIQTLTFRSDTVVDSIMITFAPVPGWGYGNEFGEFFVLSEITGTVTAEVSEVPEPSTYALLLGFISFVVVAFKKRIKA